MNRRSKPGNTTTTIIYGAVLILCVAVASLNFLIPLLIEQKHNLDAGSPYGLFIPEGTAVALPSIRISAEESASINRKFYGGAGDKAHLGGFTNFDPMGVR